MIGPENEISNKSSQIDTGQKQICKDALMLENATYQLSRTRSNVQYSFLEGQRDSPKNAKRTEN